jgi:hypothetical protein
MGGHGEQPPLVDYEPAMHFQHFNGSAVTAYHMMPPPPLAAFHEQVPSMDKLLTTLLLILSRESLHHVLAGTTFGGKFEIVKRRVSAGSQSNVSETRTGGDGHGGCLEGKFNGSSATTAADNA